MTKVSKVYGKMNHNEKLRKRLDRVKNYCQQTSLHGWAYVAGEKGFFRKLVWLVAMIGFLTLAINFLTLQIKEYNEVKTDSRQSTLCYFVLVEFRQPH